MTLGVLKILIVEDSQGARDFLVAAARAIAGAEVHECPSGFEALRLLPRHRFDLIVTDIQMPDINGFELINFVKKNPNYRATPLVVVTAEPTDTHRERALSLGANEFLMKPFTAEAFQDVLRSLLRLT